MNNPEDPIVKIWRKFIELEKERKTHDAIVRTQIRDLQVHVQNLIDRQSK